MASRFANVQFANNRPRFANVFSCFASVQFVNNQSRLANVFCCSKHISRLSTRMSGLKGRPMGEAAQEKFRSAAAIVDEVIMCSVNS